jgi:hypothetical protein
MEKFNNLVRFEKENGESLEMVIIKEFDLLNKKYAVLMGNEECDCDEHDHKCDGDCDCDHSKELFLLEVTKDNDGNEVFNDIEDEEEYKKVVDAAEKAIFDDEK